MKKAFAWDPVMRSSAIKYDPCILIDGKTKKIKCEDCKITLIADRFLGKEFQQEILGKMGKSRGRYPYVIIADGLGCNLRCWFCYAYKFFDKNTAVSNNCSIAYVSPRRLAEQFECKLEKLSDFDELIRTVESKKIDSDTRKKALNHLRMKLPLMRIRISGGEPLFSNEDTLIDTVNSDLIQATLTYWLTFFEELNEKIRKLKEEGKLSIIDKNEVKDKEWKGDLPFPTCLAERSDRLNIRFDTNGILFSNIEVTDAFIGGLFKLYQEDKLNNVFVEIDYSFKGATPIEYGWSQRQNLPVDPSRISFEYNIESHPQFPGYLNIRQTIEKYSSNDKDFYDCVGITVERGINHHTGYKTYLNCPESLNWDKFAEKTGIKFSVVDNPIEMFNWRNYKPKSCFIQNGASIKIMSGDEVFNLRDNPKIDDFDDFRKNHPNSFFVMYPVKDKIQLEKSTKIGSSIRQKKLDTYQTKLIETPIEGWVLSGNSENWKTALDNKKWGVKPELRNLWNKINVNDFVLFYVTRPVSRIIGFAKVKEIREEDFSLWPDEKKDRKVKYPLRIGFNDVSFLKKEEWGRGIRTFGLEIRHGINPIHNEKKIKEIVKTLEYKI